jgi:TctA family transporter
MADEENKQLKKVEVEDESFASLIALVSPLIKEFLSSQVKQMEMEETKDQRHCELQKAILNIEKSKVYAWSILLGILIILCFTFVGWLAFFLNQVDKALTILSYIGTAILSFLAGYGWKFRQNRTLK